MTDLTLPPLRKILLLSLILLAFLLVAHALGAFGGSQLDEQTLAESTLGRLASWMADQSGNDPEDIRSPLAHYAADWANQLGADELDPAILFASIRSFRNLYYSLILALLICALTAVALRPQRAQKLLFAAILLLDVLLFFVPSLEGGKALSLLVAAILALLVALALAPGVVSRALGFFLALSFLLVGWEASKAFADSLGYKILLPQQQWTYQTLPTMEDALDALQAARSTLS